MSKDSVVGVSRLGHERLHAQLTAKDAEITKLNAALAEKNAYLDKAAAHVSDIYLGHAQLQAELVLTRALISDAWDAIKDDDHSKLTTALRSARSEVLFPHAQAAAKRMRDLEAVAEAARTVGMNWKTGAPYGMDALDEALVALDATGRTEDKR